jgi:hypothetical protein
MVFGVKCAAFVRVIAPKKARINGLNSGNSLLKSRISTPQQLAGVALASRFGHDEYGLP